MTNSPTPSESAPPTRSVSYLHPTKGPRNFKKMSYSYANAKKIRKRTKVEQLKTEITIQKQMVNRLASALLLGKALLDKFGSQTVWLEQQEENEAGDVGYTNYIWNGEEHPTKQVQAVLEKMMERLGPLSGMFLKAPEVKSTEASQDPSSAEQPVQS